LGFKKSENHYIWSLDAKVMIEKVTKIVILPNLLLIFYRNLTRKLLIMKLGLEV